MKKTYAAVHSIMTTSTLLCFMFGCGVITKQPVITEEELQEETQRQIILAEQNLSEGTQRVADAAWPLLTRNLETCGKFTQHRTGIWLAKSTRIPGLGSGKNSDTASAIGENAEVWGVALGSPAHEAGVQRGDLLTRVDDQTVKDSKEAASSLKEVTAQFASDARTRPITLELKRGDSTVNVEVLPKDSCRSNVFVESRSGVNAVATGRSISVHYGMLRFVENERELQFILAHELAHNVAKHVEKSIPRIVVGGVVDLAFSVQRIWTGGFFAQIGRNVYSKSFEREADYLAMYYLARADISDEGIEDFWSRWGSQNISSIGSSLTHPTTPERYVNLRRTREEIESKRRQGIALFPESTRSK